MPRPSLALALALTVCRCAAQTLVTPEGFAALEGLGRVRTLKARLTGPGVRPLETMHDMQRLVLSGSPLAPEDLDIIAGAHFPELRALELERCGLAAAGTRALARGAWPHLERLVLKFNDVGPDLDHIASVCAHVTHLDLEDTRLEVIENLLNACKSIKKLVVSSNPIGAEGQQTIQSPTLEVLEMQDLDDDVDLGRMPNLHTLVMGELGLPCLLF